MTHEERRIVRVASIELFAVLILGIAIGIVLGYNWR